MDRLEPVKSNFKEHFGKIIHVSLFLNTILVSSIDQLWPRRLDDRHRGSQSLHLGTQPKRPTRPFRRFLRRPRQETPPPHARRAPRGRLPHPGVHGNGLCRGYLRIRECVLVGHEVGFPAGFHVVSTKNPTRKSYSPRGTTRSVIWRRGRMWIAVAG